MANTVQENTTAHKMNEYSLPNDTTQDNIKLHHDKILHLQSQKQKLIDKIKASKEEISFLKQYIETIDVQLSKCVAICQECRTPQEEQDDLITSKKYACFKALQLCTLCSTLEDDVADIDSYIQKHQNVILHQDSAYPNPLSDSCPIQTTQDHFPYLNGSMQDSSSIHIDQSKSHTTSDNNWQNCSKTPLVTTKTFPKEAIFSLSLNNTPPSMAAFEDQLKVLWNLHLNLNNQLSAYAKESKPHLHPKGKSDPAFEGNLLHSLRDQFQNKYQMLKAQLLQANTQRSMIITTSGSQPLENIVSSYSTSLQLASDIENQLRSYETDITDNITLQSRYRTEICMPQTASQQVTIDLEEITKCIEICGNTVNPASNFVQTFRKLSSYGQARNFNEENYKQALDILLSGAIYDTYHGIRSLPLAEVVQKLTDQFVSDQSIATYQKQLRNFQRESNESLQVTMARLDTLLNKTQTVFPVEHRETRRVLELTSAVQKLCSSGAQTKLAELQSDANAEGLTLPYSKLLQRAIAYEEATNSIPSYPVQLNQAYAAIMALAETPHTMPHGHPPDIYQKQERQIQSLRDKLDHVKSLLTMERSNKMHAQTNANSDSNLYLLNQRHDSGDHPYNHQHYNSNNFNHHQSSSCPELFPYHNNSSVPQIYQHPIPYFSPQPVNIQPIYQNDSQYSFHQEENDHVETSYNNYYDDHYSHENDFQSNQYPHHHTEEQNGSYQQDPFYADGCYETNYDEYHCMFNDYHNNQNNFEDEYQDQCNENQVYNGESDQNQNQLLICQNCNLNAVEHDDFNCNDFKPFKDYHSANNFNYPYGDTNTDFTDNHNYDNQDDDSYQLQYNGYDANNDHFQDSDNDFQYNEDCNNIAPMNEVCNEDECLDYNCENYDNEHQLNAQLEEDSSFQSHPFTDDELFNDFNYCNNSITLLEEDTPAVQEVCPFLSNDGVKDAKSSTKASSKPAMPTILKVLDNDTSLNENVFNISLLEVRNNTIQDEQATDVSAVDPQASLPILSINKAIALPPDTMITMASNYKHPTNIDDNGILPILPLFPRPNANHRQNNALSVKNNDYLLAFDTDQPVSLLKAQHSMKQPKPGNKNFLQQICKKPKLKIVHRILKTLPLQSIKATFGRLCQA